MSEMTPESVSQLRELVRASDPPGLGEILEPLHPADIAEIMGGLENEEKVRILKQLDTEKAAEVLTVVDEHSGQALLELLTDTEVVSLLGEMPSDDAVDLMAGMPPEKSKQIDALLPSDEREILHELMEFDEDTAGGIMEAEKIAVTEEATIRDAIGLVRLQADEIENIQNVYVVNEAGQLIGSVPLLDLLRHEPGTRVKDVMDDHVIAVPVDMDQEDVASLFGKYDEFTLPVVDDTGKLVGRITADDILDVVEEEASEDIVRIVGTVEEEIGETSPLKISRARLPWLVVAMLGQILNAVIMSHFAVPLEKAVALAFFIPLVIGTAGGAGIQAAVVVVREIAVGELSPGFIWRRVFRELQVTVFNGLVLGAVLFALVMLWQRDVGLGLLLLISLFTVTVAAAFMGAFIPLLMNRMKIDPAIATGPFITVLSDITGLVIYMTFATYYVAHISR
ncbi:MAG: magnesium transporter [Candidatus Latescibacterota bacterium]|nr:MAG: magnesium transporter [Candidatus Latescibacterota bacterium]